MALSLEPRHLALASSIILALWGCGARPSSVPDTLAPTLDRSHAVMNDGYPLPFDAWLPEGKARAVVLALHGFNDYRKAFADVGPFLARQGIATYAYDQRGFGDTTFRGLWAGTARMVADVKAMAALLHARYRGLPLYLLGESMGGAVVIAAVTQPDPPETQGIILAAPAVWGRHQMNVVMRTLLWLARHAAPGFRLTGEGLRIKASDNRQMLAALHRDPHIIKATRIDAISGLADLMDTALAAAPRLAVPALILYGEQDEVIPKRPTCRFLGALPYRSARHWRLALYPAGHHMLMRDLQGKMVLSDIASWIADRKAVLASRYEWRPPHEPRWGPAKVVQDRPTLCH